MAGNGLHAVCLKRKEPITNLVQSGIFIGAENWGDVGVYCIPARRFDHLPTNQLLTWEVSAQVFNHHSPA
jgi:hypothetical protein